MAIDSQFKPLKIMSIEVFDVDLTLFGSGVYRFHGYEGGNYIDPQGNIVGLPIRYNGNDYIAASLTTEGFEISSKGLPTPQLTIGNVMGQIGALVKLYDGLQGGRVIRTLLAQQPIDHQFTSADVISLEDIYTIDRPTNHTRKSITFDLKSIFDLNGSKLPHRVIFQNSCQWIYKSAQCAYIGSLPTCDKTVAGCVRHFGEGGYLTFGGYPGVDAVQ